MRAAFDAMLAWKSYFLDLSLKVAAQLKNNETNRYSEATSVADDIDIDIDIEWQILNFCYRFTGKTIEKPKNKKSGCLSYFACHNSLDFIFSFWPGYLGWSPIQKLI